MYETIVVALDGSEFASSALPVASELAKEIGSTVRAVGVAPSDAELSWTYDHVHAAAARAGLAPDDVEVVVDPDPAAVLLALADDAGNLLCLAAHDRPEPAARILKSVGTEVVQRARRPLVAVGAEVVSPAPGSDVVVGVDGVEDPGALLDVAAEWARRLDCRLRIVTVYEAVPPDVRRPGEYRCRHGPSGDPEAYVAGLRDRVSALDAARVETAAVEDAVAAGDGLESHLLLRPARLLVLGGGHPQHLPVPGRVVAHMLATASCPIVVVNHEDRDKER